MSQCSIQDHEWYEVTAIGDTHRSFCCGICSATMSTQSSRYFTWQKEEVVLTPDPELPPNIQRFLEKL